MSEKESVQELLLIGLGGSGIKTVMALRALVENDELSGRGGRQNSCRLLAIDSNPQVQNYLLDFDKENHEGYYLNQNEYLCLLAPGRNPWDKVAKDANLNIHEAEKLLARRPVVVFMDYPPRTYRIDYEAMIYESRERFKQEIRTFLANSGDSDEKNTIPRKILIATSLFGDSGSLSYLALLNILNDLSEEIGHETIDAVLFEPKGFKELFHLNTFQIATYFSVIESIYNFCFKKSPEQIVPNQRLISLHPENFVDLYLGEFTLFKEVAKKLYSVINYTSESEKLAKHDEKKPIIRIDSLNFEKCIEIKEFILDKFGSEKYLYGPS